MTSATFPARVGNVMSDTSRAHPLIDGAKHSTASTSRRDAAPWLLAWALALVVATSLSQLELVSMAIIGGSAVAASTVILRWRTLSPAAFWLFAWLGVLVALAAASGSIPPLADMQTFLAGEGRVFLAFLPLIPFLAGRRPVVTCRLIVRRVCVLTSVILASVIVAAFLPGIRQSVIRGPDGLLGGLSSSHHIPGYLGGILVVFALTATGFGPRMRMWFTAVGGAAIVLASSRTSIVGILAVAAYVTIVHVRSTRFVRTVVVGAVLIIMLLVLDQRSRDTVSTFADPAQLDLATRAFQEGDEEVIKRGDRAADVNVLRRFGVWGESFRTFTDSPVVGQGPFRLNDTDVERIQLLPGVSFVVAGDLVHSDFGAHNIVLQLAADGGIVLLVPFVLIWVALWRQGSRSTAVTGGPTANALVVFAWALSLTSNAIISPALMFPLAAVLGPLLMSDGRARVRDAA